MTAREAEEEVEAAERGVCRLGELDALPLTAMADLCGADEVAVANHSLLDVGCVASLPDVRLPARDADTGDGADGIVGESE